MSERLRVLFVCTANICRSPYMQLLADHLAGGRLALSSAGTDALDGQPVSRHLADQLRRRGVAEADVAAFRSRPLTAAMLGTADVVLTAGSPHRDAVLALDAAAAPRTFTLGEFTSAVGGTGGATGTDLVRAVGAGRYADDPALDVPDPYGRGPDAAADCALQVEALLRVAVPALAGSGRISA